MSNILTAKALKNEAALTVNGQRVNINHVNGSKAKLLGPIKGFVLHWTAGPKNATFDDYHYNIVETPNNVVAVQTLTDKQMGEHLAGRNTGMIGVTLCSMQNPKLKTNQPSPAQLDAAAVLIAELCCFKGINPESEFTTYGQKYSYADNKFHATNTTIKAPAISDHLYWAKADGYYPDRWDIDTYFAPLKANIIKYYKQLKAKPNTRSFTLTEIL